jgi:hypothetical protein
VTAMAAAVLGEMPTAELLVDSTVPVRVGESGRTVDADNCVLLAAALQRPKATGRVG